MDVSIGMIRHRFAYCSASNLSGSAPAESHVDRYFSFGFWLRMDKHNVSNSHDGKRSSLESNVKPHAAELTKMTEEMIGGQHRSDEATRNRAGW